MVIPLLIGNPYNWYINPYHWVEIPIRIIWKYREPRLRLVFHPNRHLKGLDRSRPTLKNPKSLAWNDGGPASIRGPLADVFCVFGWEPGGWVDLRDVALHHQENLMGRWALAKCLGWELHGISTSTFTYSHSSSSFTSSFTSSCTQEHGFAYGPSVAPGAQAICGYSGQFVRVAHA